MCQAWLEQTSPQCPRCGGGYSAGLGNYIDHAVWCRDDKEVLRRKRQAAERERERNIPDI